MPYLGFNSLPLLTESISKRPPHLFAELVVRFGKRPNLHFIPGVTDVTSLHEPLMALAAGVGGFVWKMGGGNGPPVEALLASTHE